MKIQFEWKKYLRNKNNVNTRVGNIYLFVVKRNCINNSKYVIIKNEILFKNDDEKENFGGFEKILWFCKEHLIFIIM